MSTRSARTTHQPTINEQGPPETEHLDREDGNREEDLADVAGEDIAGDDAGSQHLPPPSP